MGRVYQSLSLTDLGLFLAAIAATEDWCFAVGVFSIGVSAFQHSWEGRPTLAASV